MNKMPAPSMFLSLLLFLAVPPISVASAQTMPAQGESLQRQLAGTWTIVEAPEIHPDGTRGQTFGPNPKGVFMVDESGRYSLQIFQSGDEHQGMEKIPTSPKMSSHFGHCSLDPAHGVIVFRIEEASNPKWVGTEQKRQYHLSGDVLTYQVPASASSNGTIAISTWQRVR